jgi:hypothetical protein
MTKKSTVADKAHKAGIPAQTVYNRIHSGWKLKDALSTPVRKFIRSKRKVEKIVPTKKVVIPTKGTNNYIPVYKYKHKKTVNFWYFAITFILLVGALFVLVAFIAQ